jgi:hypothetical protein
MYLLEEGDDVKKKNIKLTTAEIATLWKTYIHKTAERCFYLHFLQYVKDDEIKSITVDAVGLAESCIGKIKAIFDQENFPIPQGFSDKDVDLLAPALYADVFALSFVYRAGQIITPHYANALTKVSRMDIYHFFAKCLSSETNFHKQSLSLMLSKGLNDRPPKMEYPTDIDFVQHAPSLIQTWLSEKRPANALEIAELYQDIERNAIGLIVLLGFIQVTRDKEIKDYLLKGKKQAESELTAFTTFLKEDDHFVGFPVPSVVTNSTIPPFSEKLMLFFISSANQFAVSTLGDALSVVMRKDIAAYYARVFAEVMKFGNDGHKLLVHRGWMEQPPQPMDRKEFYKNE